MDHEKGSGRICWMCTRSKLFSVGKLVHKRYVSWECKECIHLHSFSFIWACNVGGGVGSISVKKSMVDGCGYSEVWTDFIYIFSSQKFSPTYTWEAIAET